MIRRVGCALVAGLLLWVAFPSWDWWPMAPLGVGLLALATAGARPAQGFFIGLVAGWAYFGPLLSWSGIYVGAFPWFALATLQALYLGVIGLACALLQRQRLRSPGSPPAIRPLLVALVWVAGEWLRGHTPFGGFPWGRLAFSQADSPFARLAALGGAPAVTFGVALAGAALAACAVAAGVRLSAAVAATRAPQADASTPARPATWRAVGAGALALGALVAPLAIPIPTGVDPATPTGNIVAIQGDVPQAGLEFNAQRRAVLDNHARVTREAAAQIEQSGAPRPDLVLWPENASDIDPLVNADAAGVIRGAVAAIGAPTIVGAVLVVSEQNVSNTSLLYLPDGAIADTYSKLRPVPFAEYIPYRSFFRMFSDKVDLVTRDFLPGDRVGLFRVPRAGGGEVAVGINICFEVAIDDVVRDSVAQGANLIAVQTNNATFGFTDESVQQLAISRIRAIEHGRAVVHISNVGVSALIMPDGTPHQETSLFTPAILSGALPLRTEPTIATRVGSWLEWAACAVVTALLVARVLAGRRRPRTRGAGGGDDDPPAPTTPQNSVQQGAL